MLIWVCYPKVASKKQAGDASDESLPFVFFVDRTPKGGGRAYLQTEWLRELPSAVGDILRTDRRCILRTRLCKSKTTHTDTGGIITCSDFPDTVPRTGRNSDPERRRDRQLTQQQTT